MCPTNGTVGRLSIAPVKGLALNHPTEINLEPTGARGDRTFFLADDTGRLCSITRTGALVQVGVSWQPATQRLSLTLPDGHVVGGHVALGNARPTVFWNSVVLGREVIGPWSAELSRLARRALTLIKAEQPNGGMDCYPVTLIGDGTLNAIRKIESESPVDARRFRMLIETSGTHAFVEDRWMGRTMSIGSAQLRIAGPVPRCAGTTRNPDTGERDLETVRLIKELRGLREGRHADLGVYADVIEPGRIRVGDAMHLLPN